MTHVRVSGGEPRGQAARQPSGEDIFAGGGEMGVLMRSLDWARTPLGPPDGWSQSLRTMVRTLLANRFPLLL